MLVSHSLTLSFLIFNSASFHPSIDVCTHTHIGSFIVVIVASTLGSTLQIQTRINLLCDNFDQLKTFKIKWWLVSFVLFCRVAFRFSFSSAYSFALLISFTQFFFLLFLQKFTIGKWLCGLNIFFSFFFISSK